MTKRILLLSSLSLPSMCAENPLFEWSLHERQSSGLTTWRSHDMTRWVKSHQCGEWRSYTQLAKNNCQKQSKIWVSYAKRPTGNFSPESCGHGVWGGVTLSRWMLHIPPKEGICAMPGKTWKINAFQLSNLTIQFYYLQNSIVTDACHCSTSMLNLIQNDVVFIHGHVLDQEQKCIVYIYIYIIYYK